MSDLVEFLKFSEARLAEEGPAHASVCRSPGLPPEVAAVMIGDRKLIWWDRSLWWRTYHEGGFDGFRTLTNRRMSCSTMDTALRRPDLRDEIRRQDLAARRQRRSGG